MNLLDLAKELGLDPRKTSASHGGEYHCPCPSCGGNDRFMFWPEDDRYWCRQCNSKGDAIQFCRDFLGLSFQAACMKAQKNSANSNSQSRFKPADTSSIREPSGSWKDKARHFSDTAHQRLLIDKTAMGLVVQRGLSFNSIQQYRLGWNPIKAFHRRSDWGLKETENRKWICLPAGIVIPILENSQIQKLKIRKSEWKEGNFYGKYYEVPGSSNMIPIFGDPSIAICIVVEAEFDAMLVIQEAGDLCNCIAIGGAQKRPNLSTQQWLVSKKLLLFALDFDVAGKKEYFYWHESYPNLEPWPVPEEKSPGDFFVKGGSLRMWISSGLKLLQNHELLEDSRHQRL